MEWLNPASWITSGISAVGSGLAQWDANERAERAKDKLYKLRDKVKGEYEGIEGRYQPVTEEFGTDFAKYRGANKAFEEKAQNYDPTQEWQYDLPQGVREVWDPFFNEKVELATKNVYGGAANAGKLFSTATARNAARGVSKQYDESYQSALNAALEQERQEYQHYAEQVARERAAVDQANQIRLQNVTNYGELANKELGALQNLSQIGMNRISDTANLNVAAINAQAQQKNPIVAGLGQAGNTLTGFGNSYFGGQTGASNMYMPSQTSVSGGQR